MSNKTVYKCLFFMIEAVEYKANNHIHLIDVIEDSIESLKN